MLLSTDPSAFKKPDPPPEFMNEVALIVPATVVFPKLVAPAVKVPVVTRPDTVEFPLIDALAAVKALIEIFPLPSLATIALAVFAEVAVVALLLTLPTVEIVAKFASVIPAEPDKLEFVNPVTEIVPALIEIPAPAVKVACLALNTS